MGRGDYWDRHLGGQLHRGEPYKGNPGFRAYMDRVTEIDKQQQQLAKGEVSLRKNAHELTAPITATEDALGKLLMAFMVTNTTDVESRRLLNVAIGAIEALDARVQSHLPPTSPPTLGADTLG